MRKRSEKMQTNSASNNIRKICRLKSGSLSTPKMPEPVGGHRHTEGKFKAVKQQTYIKCCKVKTVHLISRSFQVTLHGTQIYAKKINR